MDFYECFLNEINLQKTEKYPHLASTTIFYLPRSAPLPTHKKKQKLDKLSPHG